MVSNVLSIHTDPSRGAALGSMPGALRATVKSLPGPGERQFGECKIDGEILKSGHPCSVSCRCTSMGDIRAYGHGPSVTQPNTYAIHPDDPLYMSEDDDLIEQRIEQSLLSVLVDAARVKYLENNDVAQLINEKINHLDTSHFVHYSTLVDNPRTPSKDSATIHWGFLWLCHKASPTKMSPVKRSPSHTMSSSSQRQYNQSNQSRNDSANSPVSSYSSSRRM